MKQKSWNIFTLLLISILFFLGAYKIVTACADFGENDIKDESLFAPEISEQDSLSPFYLSYHLLYENSFYQNNNSFDSTNLKEWYSYYNGKIDSVSLDWLLYKSNQKEIEDLQIGIAKSDEAKLALIKTHDVGYAEFLSYLALCKRFEAFSNDSYYYWGEKPEADSSLLLKQPLDFEIKWKKEKNEFFRDRYAYQWIRALFYSNNYEACVSATDLCFPQYKNSSVYFRALSYKCGALKQLSKYLESNLAATNLYLTSKEGRINAYYDFTLQNLDAIKLTAEFANDNKTKCGLWHLYGIYGSPLDGMKNIYSIDPSSELMILPLMRAVNIVELEFLNNPIYYNDGESYQESDYEYLFKNNSSKYSWRSLHNDASDSLTAFIETAIKNPSLHQTEIFKSSLAYLYYLKGNDIKATSILADIENNLSASALVKKQNYITSSLIYLRAVLSKSSLSKEEENVIANYMRSFEESSSLAFLRKTNVLRFFKLELSKYYQKNGNDIVQELALSNESDFYSKEGNLNKMIEFLEATTHTPIENYLIKNYNYQLADFYELKGNNKLYEYDFAGAINEYQKLVNAGSRKLNANPFLIHIKDCHDCDYLQNGTISKLQFAKEMLNTQNAINTPVSTEERAKLCFKLANGLYNMTYNGNNRVIAQTDFYAINYPYGSISYRWMDAEKVTLDNLTGYFDCRLAQKYYTMAEQFTANREFKAKCVFMAAKCEHNIYLETGFPGNKKEIDFIAGRNFKRLKNEFSNTIYYKEIINECGYFCSYVKGYKCKSK
jgi:hypothetical protein